MTTTDTTPTSRLHLRLDPRLDATTRSRIDHAWQIVTKTLDYQRRTQAADDLPDVVVGYGVSGDITIEPGLQLRDATTPAPNPVEGRRLCGGTSPVFHPTPSGTVDPLAEIFEWTSGLHELAVTERDGVGRIPSQQSLPMHAGLDPAKAYASRHIEDLLQAIRACATDRSPRTHTPTVCASHDLDFYPLTRSDSWTRILRNLVGSLVSKKDWGLFRQILATTARAGRSSHKQLDNVHDVVDLDRAHGVVATWAVICDRAHPRDANYDIAAISDVVAMLHEHADVAVHGSYTSLRAANALPREYRTLRELGVRASGGRQHWLRYSGLELFDALAAAGATWDSSAGYSDAVGFRHGMAGPYQRWDPRTERPIGIVEIPMVLMDVALDDLGRRGLDWRRAADEVMNEIETVGTAASILWHDTVFSEMQVARGIPELYRTLLERPYDWASLSSTATRWTGGAVASADDDDAAESAFE